jgi:hypothetical protein
LSSLPAAALKYLARHAEPEARAASEFAAQHARALIVPACRESITLLDGYTNAARAAPGRTLLVLVVNGSVDAPLGTGETNAALLEAVLRRLIQVQRVSSAPNIHYGELDAFDVLLIDRATPGSELPARQGVGLARRIGCDVALARVNSGRVASSWLFCTDADVVLPRDYFIAADAARRAAALTYPFWHEPSGEAAVDAATALYELSLRYYVLGLAWAGSPYAMHTIGSTLCIDAASYALVRGFPRRAAAEDFYVLSKLRKVGPVLRPKTTPIAIRARRSDRVPFGTGQGVDKILQRGSEMMLHDPAVFAALRRWLSASERFVEHRDPDRFMTDLLAAEVPGAGDVLLAFARSTGTREELQDALVQHSDPLQLRRRVVTWFDALRTLKLIHAVRDAVLPSVPWHTALAAAPFCPEIAPNLGVCDVDVARRALFDAEDRVLV